jgi:hypothetical protein
MEFRRSLDSGDSSVHLKDEFLALNASTFCSMMPSFSLPQTATDFALMEDSDNSETLPVLQLGDSTRFPASETPCHSSVVLRACSDAFTGATAAKNISGTSSNGLGGTFNPAASDSYGEDGQLGGGQDGKVRKGQGYRRLWQMVTKVQRGDRLGGGSFEWQDCTVEDLLKIVQQLPANSSAVKAVTPGLVYLDSRAAAALFKALAKSGHGGRAVEIFDHLRLVLSGLLQRTAFHSRSQPYKLVCR